MHEGLRAAREDHGAQLRLNFLVPLMLEVVRLAIIHKDKRVIEVAGAPLNIDAEAWTERTTCTVSQHLGYGEKDLAANKLGQGYQMMAQDQGLGNMFGAEAALRNAARHRQAQRLQPLRGLSRSEGAASAARSPQGSAKLHQDDKCADDAVTAQTKQQDANRLFRSTQTKVEHNAAPRYTSTRSTHDRTNDRQDTDTAARIQQGEEQIDVEREKIDAQERTAARNAAAKAAQPKGPSA
jgi:hypothetical protein